MLFQNVRLSRRHTSVVRATLVRLHQWDLLRASTARLASHFFLCAATSKAFFFPTPRVVQHRFSFASLPDRQFLFRGASHASSNLF
ncbi:hypothetical protein NDU88_006456 [Pleurodeles waltl]|uniref:Secreted protein n=1 Tax=Pleurodeles waltl TaxID=8319 RepID=A0AAV7QLC7_PLEWA|nr:hypothetical protein NDU88_006456 [Pleurodeles waltl]